MLTVNNIDTRLFTEENAGYVSAASLDAYGFATEGYIQTAVENMVAVDANGDLTHNSGSFRVGNAWSRSDFWDDMYTYMSSTTGCLHYRVI